MTGNGFTFSSATAGKRTLKKALSIILAGCLIFSNLHVYAEDIRADAAAPGAQQPAVLQAANGVPQVNIKAPNSAGLSHNTYSAFDVAPRGVILNNSRTDVNTQLGGFVTANPEMAGGEAWVILNEINSNKRSDINGFIEIAGKRADVIVANPSGISCKNCGFINAQQGTLTTGEVHFNGGQIEGYKVEQGSIELNGFNAEDADYASIISRAVEINGDVRAQELRVTTGLNSVDAANLTVQRGTATATAAPQFSLDVKALGGMYAGKITLTGTEDGVGVRNAGTIGATAGELVIRDGQLMNSGSINSAAGAKLDIAGKLKNSKVINAQSLTLTATELNSSGTLTAATTLTATVESVTNSGDLGSQKHLNIHAAESVTNLTGGRIIGGSATLTTEAGALINAGKISSTEHLNIHAKTSVDNQTGGQLIGGPTTLTAAGGMVTNGGVISSTEHLNIHAKTSVDNQTGGQMIGGSATLTAEAGAVTNGGDIGTTEHLSIDAAHSIENQTGSLITAGSATLTADAGAVTNAGEIGGAQQLKIHAAQTIENTGGSIIGGSAVLTATGILNRGSNALLAVTDPAKKLAIHASESLINEDEALIYSQGDLSVDGRISDSLSEDTAAQQLTNRSATIEVLGDISFKLDQLLNESAGHNEITTETTTETVRMRIPSWLTNGSNGGKGVKKSPRLQITPPTSPIC